MKSKEQVKLGLKLIEDAILGEMATDESGWTADQLSETLGLETEIEGGFKNGVTRYFLANLEKREQVRKLADPDHKRHFYWILT
jgi:hypothetical protein